MKREIKFRVWDNKEGKFVSIPIRWDLDEKGVAPAIIFPSDKDITVLPFIGLMDKKGVEIYEGDIYRRQNYLYRVFWDNEEMQFLGHVIARKKDRGEGYEIPPIGKSKIQFVQYLTAEIEVIGNIHQNPELIK